MEGSITEDFPFVLIVGGGYDVADDIAGIFHRADHRFAVHNRSGRNNLSDRLAVAGDADGLTGAVHVLDQGAALGPKFGDGNFDHGLTNWFFAIV